MVYIASVVPAQPVSSVAVTRSVTAPLPSAWKVIASVLAPLTIVPLTMDHWNDAYGDAPGTTCAVSVAFVGIGSVVTAICGVGLEIGTVMLPIDWQYSPS